MADSRRRMLVGRGSEQALFQSLIAAAELPVLVLSIYGPGGVGKTTLVRTFADYAARSGVPVIFIDSRNIDATPEGFERAYDAALAEAAPPPAAAPVRRVLIVDTYETLLALDGWLRDVFLPKLSAETLVVLAGRLPLPAAWRADSGWQGLIRSIALRNLAPEDSRIYLEQRAVPPRLHREALDFTHGHPLALSLIADVLTRPGGAIEGALSFSPESAPDVVHALLERFVEQTPTPLHRTALEACALVRYTDQSLLEHMLTDPDAEPAVGTEPLDARALFEWLRGLSFIESSANGIFPHDIAREALLADLRWRNRDWYIDLHRRARDFYARRLRGAQGQNQERLLYDAIFLHRDSAVIRTAFTWQESQSSYPDTLKPGDAEAICAMVARHEGEESAGIAADWLRRQPEATVVFRDLAEPNGQPVGFFSLLTLQAPEAGAADDPDRAAAAALRYLAAHAPLRPGEVARYLRFWMAAESYQHPSPVQSLIIVHALRQFLLQSRVAVTLFACADPEMWAPVFEYVEIDALAEAAFTIGDRRYRVFGQDWRLLPATAWLSRLFDREVAAGSGRDPAPREPVDSPLIVLSEPEFASSVRDAWRAYLSPDKMATNPLLRSRLVVSRAGETASNSARAEALRTLLREAAEAQQSAPRDARGFRALRQTYIAPAATQEQAAEILDLPFNTYRRHLGEGIAAVAARLWQLEVGSE